MKNINGTITAWVLSGAALTCVMVPYRQGLVFDAENVSLFLWSLLLALLFGSHVVKYIGHVDKVVEYWRQWRGKEVPTAGSVLAVSLVVLLLSTVIAVLVVHMGLEVEVTFGRDLSIRHEALWYLCFPYVANFLMMVWEDAVCPFVLWLSRILGQKPV